MKKLLLTVLWALALVVSTSCDDKNKIGDPTLSITPDTPIVWTNAGGTKTIAVTTDLPSWDVASSQIWCSVDKSTDGKSFTVTAQKYLGRDPQPDATITVTATNGSLKKTVTLSVKQTGDQVEPFAIAVTDVTAGGGGVAVVPTDKTARYYFDVISKESLAVNHSGDLGVYMVNMIANAVEQTEGDMEMVLEIICSIGDDSHSYTNLLANTEYVAFAAGLDNEGKVSTRIIQSEFTTLDNTVDMSFAISNVKTYYDGFDYTITPSNLEERFYTTFRPAAKYKGLSNEQILALILTEDSFMIDFMAKSGAYVYKNDGVGNTGTTHYVFAFGWNGGAPSTPLTKFEIKTESVDIPAGSSFTITPAKITSRSAEVTVTPTVDKAMYLWDLMDEKRYNQYKNDLPAFLAEYVGQSWEQLDRLLVRGENSYQYTKQLNPNSKYYVWSVYLDENGQAVGDIMVSAPFSTLAMQPSAATVTSSIAKYFNGDDLYAKDPVKYKNAQGMAYVPIAFAANNVCQVWYANMFAEDPKDPTSAISDLDMALMLESGVGIWCNIGRIYYCQWGVEHVALAVGIESNDNFGPVLRDKYIFTKEKASPISEFVEPTNPYSTYAPMIKHSSKPEPVKAYRTAPTKKG